jgi:hypothetical protein
MAQIAYNTASDGENCPESTITDDSPDGALGIRAAGSPDNAKALPGEAADLGTIGLGRKRRSVS